MAFLSFPNGWPWGISRDAPPPPPASVRTFARSVVWWPHNQIFLAWWVTNFSYPWCFAGALCALKLHYKPRFRTNIGKQTTSPMATEMWQQLPTHVKNFPTHNFPKKLKEYVLAEQLTYWNYFNILNFFSLFFRHLCALCVCVFMSSYCGVLGWVVQSPIKLTQD